MTLLHEERPSDSAYVESVTHGWTTAAGSTIRPAESHWHLVLVKHDGQTQMLAVGPLSSSGLASWGANGEILWIKFKLGAFMPHLPVRSLRDSETPLPEAARQAFWLKGSAWRFPDFDNADTFVDRLARQGVLAFDPLVEAALRDRPPDVPERTLRHRFLQATGFTQGRIRQFQRAQRAAGLLRQGRSILDTVYEAGYTDQPHLTRSLKQWLGHTPAQLVRGAEVG